MMMTFEVKCTGNTQSHEGNHTATFRRAEGSAHRDALRQELKIVSPEMPFTVGEVYFVSVSGSDAKKKA